MAARRQPEMLGAGARAPAFELKDVNGASQSLSGLLARGPVLLAFFKASCPVCQFTFPFLERLYQGRGEGALQIVGVSQDKAGATRDFNQEFGVTFPVLLDEAGKDYPVSNAYGIHTVPSLFLIEPDGTIASSENGFVKKELEALGRRAGVAPFQPGEPIPDYKPG